MADFYVLFNHQLTDDQADQARQQLGVENIITPPEEVSRCWAEIPPEPDAIRPHLAPVFTWINTRIQTGSFLLVQGEFGACYLVLRHLEGTDITPVYATTKRRAIEQRLDNNSVRLTHTFRHVRYRIYGR